MLARCKTWFRALSSLQVLVASNSNCFLDHDVSFHVDVLALGSVMRFVIGLSGRTKRAQERLGPVFGEECAKSRETCTDNSDVKLHCRPSSCAGVVPRNIRANVHEIQGMEPAHRGHCSTVSEVSLVLAKSTFHTYNPPNPRISMRLIFSRFGRMSLRRMKNGKATNATS